MKSKDLKSYNLPNDRNVNTLIDAKPYGPISAVIVVGLILAFFKQTTVYGLLLSGIGTLILTILPRRIMIEFADEYMILYNKASAHDCVLIYYEDILYWDYLWGIYNDELRIGLVDGSVERIEAYSKQLFESNMNRYVKDKKKKK